MGPLESNHFVHLSRFAQRRRPPNELLLSKATTEPSLRRKSRTVPLHWGPVAGIARTLHNDPVTKEEEGKSGPWTVQLRNAAASLRFPMIPLSLTEWLLTGIATCGAAAAAGTAGTDAGTIVAGWAGVTVAVGVSALWLIATRWVVTIAARAQFVDTNAPLPRSPCVPVAYSRLRARVTWGPLDETRRTGVLFEAMRSAPLSWWRWATITVMTLVAGVTGAGGVRGGCEASLSVCAFVLLTTALLLAVVRPYNLPSENVCNPLKFACLGTTCVVLLLLSRDESAKATALAVLGWLQMVLTVIRFAVKGYVRVEGIVVGLHDEQQKQEKQEEIKIRTEFSDDDEPGLLGPAASPPTSTKVTSQPRTVDAQDAAQHDHTAPLQSASDRDEDPIASLPPIIDQHAVNALDSGWAVTLQGTALAADEEGFDLLSGRQTQPTYFYDFLTSPVERRAV